MEDNTNKDHISQQKNELENAPEPAQVPPSLLPSVLHRLGLTLEQAHQDIAAEEAMVQLKSTEWEERAQAVHFLGKRAVVISLALLEAALSDEDGSVRARAVHAMGDLSNHIPLHRLVQALQDPDWHVRETAVFVLGKQEPRVPDEVFKAALYDTDSSVREAARYVLQRDVFPVGTSIIYEQVQEKKHMQQESDGIETTSRDGRSPYETEAFRSLSANNEYQGYAESSHSLRELSQAYAPPEQVPYAYSAERQYGEKVMSVPAHRSSKKWWVIIPLVAICFFILGVMSVGLIAVTSSRQAAFVQHAQPQPQIPGDTMLALLKGTNYTSLLENEVSSGLNLTPQQIVVQLQAGKSMTDIARAQGLSTEQLRKIETRAFTDTLQAMVKAGDVSQSEANTWQERNLRNPEQVDRWTRMIFLFPVSAPGGT